MKKIMTKESKKLVKCPCCLRAFQSIEDYPIVEIVSFSRTEVPKYVGATHCDRYVDRREAKAFGDDPLPRDVEVLFRKTKRKWVVNQGKLYSRLTRMGKTAQAYEGSEDLTGIFKESLALPEIQSTLSALEGLVGKKIPTGKLFSLPGFQGKLKVQDWNDICLEINDREFRGARNADVYLAGGGVGGYMSSAALWQELAKIKYIGRIMSG